MRRVRRNIIVATVVLGSLIAGWIFLRLAQTEPYGWYYGPEPYEDPGAISHITGRLFPSFDRGEGGILPDGAMVIMADDDSGEAFRIAEQIKEQLSAEPNIGREIKVVNRKDAATLAASIVPSKSAPALCVYVRYRPEAALYRWSGTELHVESSATCRINVGNVLTESRGEIWPCFIGGSLSATSFFNMSHLRLITEKTAKETVISYHAKEFATALRYFPLNSPTALHLDLTAQALKPLRPEYIPCRDADVLDEFAPVLLGSGPSLFMPNLTRWRIYSSASAENSLAKLGTKLAARGWKIVPLQAYQSARTLIARKDNCTITALRVEERSSNKNDKAAVCALDVVYTEMIPRNTDIQTVLSLDSQESEELRHFYYATISSKVWSELNDFCTPDVLKALHEGEALMQEGKVEEGIARYVTAVDMYEMHEKHHPAHEGSHGNPGFMWYFKNRYSIEDSDLHKTSAARRTNFTELKSGAWLDLGSAPVTGRFDVYLSIPDGQADSRAVFLRVRLDPESDHPPGVYMAKLEVDTPGQYLSALISAGKTVSLEYKPWRVPVRPRAEVSFSPDGKTFHVRFYSPTPDDINAMPAS